MPRTRKERPSAPRVIDPEILYGLPDFLRCARLGSATLTAARAAGHPIPKIVVGRVAYVQGRDGIAWLHQLAAAKARVGRPADQNA